MKVTKVKGRDGRSQYRLSDKISWMVPGDIHLPFQDNKAVDQMIGASKETGLFITGDLIDYYWISSWPKTGKLTKQGGLKATRSAVLDFVAKTRKTYDFVVYGAGNHELRIETLSRKYPGFDGEWYWMFADLLPTDWIYLDHGYRCVLPQKSSSGLPIVLEHGDRVLYGGTPNAARLVSSYPNQCTIIGHNHKVQEQHKVTWKAGRSTLASAYTVGHLSDIRLNNYANNPDWHHGWATVSADGVIETQVAIGGKLV